MIIFIQGLTMGLAYVAPIGLQNLFVINAALTGKRRFALLTAIITIFFDISLALAAFYGMGAILTKWNSLRLAILLLGGLAVLWIGFGLLTKKPDAQTQQAPVSLIRTIFNAFIVTWANPQALIDGTLMLGAFRTTLSVGASHFFILGVCVASLLWFTTLSTIVSSLEHRFSAQVLLWINRICGAVILLYGAKLLWTFLATFF